MLNDPGSFRDPAGVVLHIDDRIYRVVSPAGANQFERARDSGLLAELADRGLLIPYTEVDPGTLHGRFDGAASWLLEHPKLDFVSYPYEWPFPALKAAALLHLDIHLAALEKGFTLSDASAFNVQFIGARPVFIDHLSFREYRDGEFWYGHGQFCEQFLNPLLLRAMCGVAYHPWYRSSMNGITCLELSRMLPWYRKFLPLVFLHVVLPAFLQSRHRVGADAAPRRPLPLASFKAMLTGLRGSIERLKAPRETASPWADYASNTIYSPDETTAKHRFISEFVEQARPRVVWDMGCNAGDYAVACLDAGAELVIGFDNDLPVLDIAYHRASTEGLAFLPLFMDATNPSPSQGWRESERAGLAARTKPDGLIALALLHHLAIRNNVPMADALDWLISIAPAGVIEFIPKQDPMVQELLSLREDIFPGYTREAFLELVTGKARIVREAVVTPEGRTLIWYQRDG